ncbi:MULTISPECIES: APC family permease [unclassified Facklamia]|uniref:APC family permease n=1 Tax=Aerococcaceae TaxID=186827 RepID=UPI0013B9CCCC|nr:MULTISPECIES: APC family permease [unclassified Facklamia]NEW63739.1 amino acid permease [Facklamia sp. 252]NEW67210.1 amino acid permease [Facklamia sp. 253]QQD66251.1 APC family permease [Aerococcaceae bacterium zg-252]
MKQENKTYGLITAITMIVGIVIGSGIYFRADNVLVYAGGNVGLGMLALALGASCIIFGSLSLSELAQRTTSSGGISSYYEEFISPGIAAAIGFFQAFVYLPTVIVVVAWVAAIYTWMYMGITSTLEMQIILAAIYIILFIALNYYSRRFGGYYQSLSTIIKVIPLLIIAIIGIFWNKDLPEIPTGITVIQPKNVGFGWLAALVPLAFSYDGWTAVISIAPEIRDPKRNLAKALIMGPLFILLTYLLFFFGLNKILGASFIMSVGDDAIHYALRMLFGSKIGNFILLIIIISVLGVVNGMLLALIRLPQAFAQRKWLNSKRLATVHPKYQVSTASTLLILIVALGWLAIHYIVQKFDLLYGRDVSEIAIVFNNLAFAVLYFKVIQLYRRQTITQRFTGLISPIFAILGSLSILIGSLTTAPMYVLLFQCFCLCICFIGYWLYHQNRV